MLSPDLHITIHISEEIVRMMSATVGFAIAIWGMVKIITIIANSANKQSSENQ